MAIVKFRQLIDMAIGSPEPGHVNFYALHCLLNSIAEKLNITDEAIDYSKYEAMTICSASAKGSHHNLSRLFGSDTRLCAGFDPEVDNNDENAEGTALDAIGEENSTATYETKSTDDVVGDSITNPVLETEVPDVEPTTSEVVEIQSALPEAPKEAELIVQTHVADLSPRMSVTPNETRSNVSVHKLDDRISKLEDIVEKLAVPEAVYAGIAIMKDQLELSMDLLLLLTVLTLSKKPETHRVQQLHSLAQTLRVIRNENVYVRGSDRFDLHNLTSIDWRSSELQLNEMISEEVILESRQYASRRSSDMSSRKPENRYDLEDCLCYSPGKMLDQLMELKGDFCLLTNKVNELSARLLKQESQQTLALIHELQEQMRDLKLTTNNLQEVQDRQLVRVTSTTQSIDIIRTTMEEVISEKVDKAELEIILADKVDYNQLQRKVSLDQLLEVQCRIDKKFCEVFRQISENDKKYGAIIESLEATLGFAAIEGILTGFKEQIAKEIHALHHLLRTYIDSTNDECAAAGTRFKVLQNLACLSCDTTCVMRSMEKAKVSKLPNARTTATLSPLITYELGSIRKSGIMGYYRKGAFPHAPNAWMKRQGQSKVQNQAVPRHAGGSHTTSTARDRVDKVLLNKS